MQEGTGRADITRLLLEWQGGNSEALERLVPMVYDELHTLASRYLAKERRGHTLQTTALVNEAYLKLVAQRRVDWKSRAHFFGVAAQLMRRILVDHARRRGRAKHGGRALHVTLEGEPASPDASRGLDVFALDRALSRLEARDARQGRVVELRFFGGLTIEETAEVMSLSPVTIKRDWAVARAWLYRELAGEASRSGGQVE